MADILTIAALGAVGALWIFSVMGILHVGWKTGIKPIVNCLKDSRRNEK